MSEITDTFQVGQYVVCRNHGICQVEDITTLDFSVVDSKKKFYVLHPIEEKDGKVYVGVDSHQDRIRGLISREQAMKLVEEIPDIDTLWVADEKTREEKYKECLRNCNCRDWVKIIKTIYMRKCERIAQGKKITNVDERYFKIAEDHLYNELALALGMTREGVFDFIMQRMETVDTK